MKTLGQIAYEAAAEVTGCQQPWSEATKEKWDAAAKAVAERCAKECEETHRRRVGSGRKTGYIAIIDCVDAIREL
jgi:hypothetical protein